MYGHFGVEADNDDDDDDDGGNLTKGEGEKWEGRDGGERERETV